MREIYISSNIKSIKKLNISSRITQIKDTTLCNISNKITKTAPSSKKTSYARRAMLPVFAFDQNSSEERKSLQNKV